MEICETPKPVKGNVVHCETGSHSNRAFDPVHAESFVETPPALGSPDQTYCLVDGGVVVAVACHPCNTAIRVSERSR